MKIRIFVGARTPVSSVFSMLDSGIETCPPADGAWARMPETASNATINTENTKQRHRRTSQHPFDRPALLTLTFAKINCGLCVKVQ